MADLKLVYAAPTEETALNELELFKDKWVFFWKEGKTHYSHMVSVNKKNTLLN